MKPTDQTNESKTDSEILSELSQHKNNPEGLKDASPELLAVVCRRWAKCPAFAECKGHDFTGRCCCLVTTTRKVEWVPQEVSRPTRRRHEKLFRAAWSYACVNAPKTDWAWFAASEHLLKFQFQFGVDLMQEARAIVTHLHEIKIEDYTGTDKEKGQLIGTAFKTNTNEDN